MTTEFTLPEHASALLRNGASKLLIPMDPQPRSDATEVQPIGVFPDVICEQRKRVRPDGKDWRRYWHLEDARGRRIFSNAHGRAYVYEDTGPNLTAPLDRSHVFPIGERRLWYVRDIEPMRIDGEIPEDICEACGAVWIRDGVWTVPNWRCVGSTAHEAMRLHLEEIFGAPVVSGTWLWVITGEMP